MTQTKLSREILDEIRKHFREASPYDVVRLLDHIAALEAERDAARKLIEEMRALQREGAEKPH